MQCYRSGGCGPYEMRSCGECPASKESYLRRREKSINRIEDTSPLLVSAMPVEGMETHKIMDKKTGEVVARAFLTEDNKYKLSMVNDPDLVMPESISMALVLSKDGINSFIESLDDRYVVTKALNISC